MPKCRLNPPAVADTTTDSNPFTAFAYSSSASTAYTKYSAQVHTDSGGYIDLLAINSDGELIVIVAESLDDSTERIVQHLNEVHKVNINAVFFNVFTKDGKEFIGRSCGCCRLKVKGGRVAPQFYYQ